MKGHDGRTISIPHFQYTVTLVEGSEVDGVRAARGEVLTHHG